MAMTQRDDTIENGRMGRLWQTVLFGSWNPLFYGAPIENTVWAHQSEYYAAIRAVEEHDMDIAPHCRPCRWDLKSPRGK